jgi:hypothetical protein
VSRRLVMYGWTEPYKKTKKLECQPNRGTLGKYAVT